jgi:cytochrome c oxidase subunit II
MSCSSVLLPGKYFLGIVAFLQRSVDPGRHSALQPVGPESARMEWVYWIIFWICLAVFLLMLFGFARGSRRGSKLVSDPAVVIEDPEADRRSQWGVGIAVAVTTVTLFIVLIFSVTSAKVVQAVGEHNPVTIELTGHQWWWEVVYPNSEPDLQVTTANEIHVPVGERIVVVTKSADVIHSFWVPNVTGKRDLIPGYASAISFRVDQPGFYRGQCAEFCGLQHAHMGLLLIAESRASFDTWRQAQLQDAAEPADPQTRRGREVFLSHACVMCHTIQGTTAASRTGPDLTHIASRTRIAGESLPNVPGALGGWILDPQGIKPGNHMVPNTLSGDELQALIAYLQSLK